ncbi:hypothetical protein CMO92_00205 [Candidatus Woesearchaeota archaeon]|nr:hypothetical protein [Candidatus Woesearchaeota archaeon]
MDVAYIDELKKAWKGVGENKQVFVPYVYLLLVLVIGGVLVGLEALLIYFGDLSWMWRIVLIIFFVLVDLVVVLGGFFYVNAMQFKLYREIVRDGRTQKGSIFSKGKEFFWRLVRLKVLTLLLFIVFAIVLFLIAALFFAIHMVVGIVMAVLLGIVGLVGFLFLVFGLLFSDPIITTEVSAVEAIRKSMRFFWNNPLVTLLTILVGFVVSLVLYTLYTILLLMSMVFLLIPFLGVVLQGLVHGVYIVSSIIAGVVVVVFVFRVYFLVSGDLKSVRSTRKGSPGKKIIKKIKKK